MMLTKLRETVLLCIPNCMFGYTLYEHTITLRSHRLDHDIRPCKYRIVCVILGVGMYFGNESWEPLGIGLFIPRLN